MLALIALGTTGLAILSSNTDHGAQAQIYGANGLDLAAQLRSLDAQIQNTAYQTILQTVSFLQQAAVMQALMDEQVLDAATRLSTRRDELIARGIAPGNRAVLAIEHELRKLAHQHLGISTTNKIEDAISLLKAQRDAVLRQLGPGAAMKVYADSP